MAALIFHLRFAFDIDIVTAVFLRKPVIVSTAPSTVLRADAPISSGFGGG